MLLRALTWQPAILVSLGVILSSADDISLKQ